MNNFCYNELNNIYFKCNYLKKDMLNNQLITHIINVFTDSLKNNNQFIINADLKGIKMSLIDIDFIKKFISIVNNLFENRLQQCELTNYPDFFKNVYNIIKKFIDKETRKKIIWN